MKSPIFPIAVGFIFAILAIVSIACLKIAAQNETAVNAYTNSILVAPKTQTKIEWKAEQAKEDFDQMFKTGSIHGLLVITNAPLRRLNIAPQSRYVTLDQQTMEWLPAQTNPPIILLRTFMSTNVVYETRLPDLTPKEQLQTVYRETRFPVSQTILRNFVIGFRDGTNEVEIATFSKEKK